MRVFSGLELNSAGHRHSRSNVAYPWAKPFSMLCQDMHLFFHNHNSYACFDFLQQEAINLLEPMTNDPVNYVRQGALIASALIMIQQTEVTCPKVRGMCDFGGFGLIIWLLGFVSVKKNIFSVLARLQYVAKSYKITVIVQYPFMWIACCTNEVPD